jgi:hypothetical protein
VVEKSEDDIGMDIESRVVEKAVWLDLSFSKPDHDSLLLGHSLKKGRRGWPSSFTASPDPYSLDKNECWG